MDNPDIIKLTMMVESQKEQIQQDLLCVLDGLDDRTLDLVCKVVVDRCQLISEQVKQCRTR